MDVDEKVTLSLPAKSAYLPIAACAATECAAGRGFSKDEGNAIGVALEDCPTIDRFIRNRYKAVNAIEPCSIATVYLAKSVKQNTVVALKVLDAERTHVPRVFRRYCAQRLQ